MSEFQTRCVTHKIIVNFYSVISYLSQKALSKYVSVFSWLTGESKKFFVSNDHKKCDKFHLKNISNSSVKCYTIRITFFSCDSLDFALSLTCHENMWRHQTCFCLLLYFNFICYYFFMLTSIRLQSQFILRLLQLLNVHILTFWVRWSH